MTGYQESNSFLVQDLVYLDGISSLRDDIELYRSEKKGLLNLARHSTFLDRVDTCIANEKFP